MRLIDADALMKEHCDRCSLDLQESCKADPVCASMMWIVEAPTVDAVEVVRCKDCKRVYRDKYSGCYFCHERQVRSDHFCSYGERRTDDSR